MNKKDLILELNKLNVINPGKILEYVNFCLDNNKEPIKGKTEKHHILPKAASLPFEKFKNLNIFTWNKVNLTFVDHYIAHSILAEAVTNSAVLYAWWNMNSQNIKKKGSFNFDQERYSILKEKHLKLVSEQQIKRNKSKKQIINRFNTMMVADENGETTFQRQGKKISSTLIKNGSVKGIKNPMYGKVIVKLRSKPTEKIGVSTDYDNKKYVPFQMNFLKLFDNKGNLFFEGYRDECINFCNELGLEGEKIPAKGGLCFNYNTNHKLNRYLIKVMKMADLGKYLNSTAIVIKSEDVTKKYEEVFLHESKS